MEKIYWFRKIIVWDMTILDKIQYNIWNHCHPWSHIWSSNHWSVRWSLILHVIQGSMISYYELGSLTQGSMISYCDLGSLTWSRDLLISYFNFRSPTLSRDHWSVTVILDLSHDPGIIDQTLGSWISPMIQGSFISYCYLVSITRSRDHWSVIVILYLSQDPGIIDQLLWTCISHIIQWLLISYLWSLISHVIVG